MAEQNYWLLSCNPAKWEIDLAIRDGLTNDHWLVGTADEGTIRAGDLALVRVGKDHRTAAELNGRSPLKPGIYGLCSIEGDPVPGDGSYDRYWRGDDDAPPSQRRQRRHVPIKWLQTFLDQPLLLQTLDASPPILEQPDLIIRARGLLQSTGRISGRDFETIVGRLGTSIVTLTKQPIDAETHVDDRLIDASVEDHVYDAMVRRIEDGGVGELVKKANGYKCQICSTLGVHGHIFLKKDGTPYVEAYHAVPRHQMVRVASGQRHRGVCRPPPPAALRQRLVREAPAVRLSPVPDRRQ